MRDTTDYNTLQCSHTGKFCDGHAGEFLVESSQIVGYSGYVILIGGQIFANTVYQTTSQVTDTAITFVSCVSHHVFILSCFAKMHLLPFFVTSVLILL